jgi:hypothetical protein
MPIEDETIEEGEEASHIPAGIFKIRLPFIHYDWESSEMLKGAVLVATGLGAIPLITNTLGISYELALTLVIFNGALYVLHATLGDPVVPGWITPAIPLTVLFLEGFPKGPERIKALIALQIIVGIIFLIMGSLGAARRIIQNLPNSLMGGIVLGAGLAAIRGEIVAGGRFVTYPLTIGIAGLITYYLIFNKYFQDVSDHHRLYKQVAKFGMLPPLALAIFLGPLTGELSWPTIEWKLITPDVTGVITQVSPLGVGFPDLQMFVAAIPMALTAYIIAFGDFVTAKGLIEEASAKRPDEYVDFNSNRSNLVSGVRNIIMGFVAPFVPLCGPLWGAVTATISQKFGRGQDFLGSIWDGLGTFRWTTFLILFIGPVVTVLKPILPVALSLTLLVQGYICARIGMSYLDTDKQKGIGGIMAIVMAIKGAQWGLGTGIILYFLLSRPESIKKTLKGFAYGKEAVATTD